MDKTKCIKLLKKNRYCCFCLQNHKSTDCPNPNKVCGGGKPNRGCSKNHKLHEMLCADAKVFMAHSMTANDKKEGVVFLIMSVKTLKRGISAMCFFD